MEYIQIYWSCATLDEARKISRHLIQKRWVATAKIIPWMETIFLCDEQLDTMQESQVILVTLDHLFEQIKTFILNNSKYEVPEILKLPILDGNPDYLTWMKDRLNE
jgi:periplasmic divalent cation tolerance protein